MRVAAFALWALAAGSAAYWLLKFVARPAPPALAPGVARASTAVDPLAVARVLGANPVAAAAAVAQAPQATRFSLVGVVARASGSGAALISVDGKPPKHYRVGSAVDEGLMVQSVQARKAVLAATARGPALVTLELPVAAKR